MISFGTLAQQVNVVEANKQTNALIENQISAIDASVLAQLEAQESSVAVVDGNLYQKDSEGGWAMVGATSAALVAGLFSSSSSNTSGSNGSDLPGNLPNIDAVNPVENTPANPIEATPDADNGRQVDQIADNMWQVSTHGEVDGYLSLENGTVYVRDSDHNLVKEWKPTLGHPIQIDPANPIEATPDADNGRQVDQIADNMWQVSTHGEVDGYLSIENGTVYVRDSDHNLVTEWKPTLGHPIQIDPANPIEATPDADNGRQLAKVGDNVWMITTHDAIDGYVIDERHHNDGVKVYDENGKLVNHITGDISTDGGYIESTKGGEIHITVDRESGRIDGIYLNDVAQQTVDNIKSHIGSNPNFKKNIQQLKNRVMNARG